MNLPASPPTSTLQHWPESESHLSPSPPPPRSDERESRARQPFSVPRSAHDLVEEKNRSSADFGVGAAVVTRKHTPFVGKAHCVAFSSLPFNAAASILPSFRLNTRNGFKGLSDSEDSDSSPRDACLNASLDEHRSGERDPSTPAHDVLLCVKDNAETGERGIGAGRDPSASAHDRFSCLEDSRGSGGRRIGDANGKARRRGCVERASHYPFTRPPER